jgi:uncharacterized protein
MLFPVAAKSLSRADAARALATYSLQPDDLRSIFARLRSVQFDPLRPAGCNHDLVLQARVADYRLGNWEGAAYEGERSIYDGWDKQASLIAMDGWTLRRIYHEWNRPALERFREEYGPFVDGVLSELAERGPLAPGELSMQETRHDWRGSWYGPSVAKRALRHLWHAGLVMTSRRKGQQHVYDLTERVVPEALRAQPPVSEGEAVRQLVLERHRAVGLLRPGAAAEVWSMRADALARREAIEEGRRRGDLVPIDVEGTTVHAVPELLQALDKPPVSEAVVLAPLDQILWDRKLIAYLFGFEYLWEVYKPATQRRWGYYSLPILFDGRFVARFDPWCRRGTLEIRTWHWEPGEPRDPATLSAVENALVRFMAYCGATDVVTAEGVHAAPVPRAGGP